MKGSLDRFFGALREIRLTEAEKDAIARTLGIAVRKKESQRHHVYSRNMNREQFFTLARSVRLSPAERALIRESLLSKADPPSGALWLHPFRHFSTLIASVLVIVIGSGGIAFAAEDALPGDFLYPVKVHVTETIRAGFIGNPGNIVAWNAERAERRLREAEILAERGTLNAKALATIQKRFRKHAGDVRTGIAMLAKTDADGASAQSIGADFEAGLGAHLKALVLLKGTQSVSASALDLLLTDIEDERIETEVVILDSEIAEALAAHTDIALDPILERVNRRIEEAREKNATKSDVHRFATEHMTLATEQFEQVRRETSMSVDMRFRLARQALRHAREASILPSPASEAINAAKTTSAPAFDVVAPPPPSGITSPKPAQLPSVRAEDLLFDTKVRMRMTERGIDKTRRLMQHLSKPLPDTVSIGVESEITGAQGLMTSTREQLDAGEGSAALDAADSALKHVREAQKRVETEIGIGGE